ncbi:MAG: class I SAM-dependent methyltransferase [Sediminimonas qiaohouensis]|uniref:Class I SAM-dependent methyltransferase n=1 Tax=Sediminimonas qiaohouensis TaxID=552061 RepID=A0A7C9HCK6_9RHOB|nr:class I SAM-dependent methyltransferase [Sediminimonas qiaohouensis]MTJ05325.1 class I SAM-dependent methyltransferase [Sediminimonas qiaohouensis]
MDLNAVKSSYARWAPVYDKTFGAITEGGRRRAVAHVNTRGGTVLEVGVGTGLSLEHYDPAITVTGIDFSDEMLAKARHKVARRALDNVASLRQMDARTLDFPDNSFDTVVAMHIVSVVPDPEQVMTEMARVCKPGGQVVITNHFAREKGVMAVIERLMAPFEKTLGWHSDFPLTRVTGEPTLQIVTKRPIPPLGMMTFLVMEKAPAG